MGFRRVIVITSPVPFVLERGDDQTLGFLVLPPVPFGVRSWGSGRLLLRRHYLLDVMRIYQSIVVELKCFKEGATLGSFTGGLVFVNTVMA